MKFEKRSKEIEKFKMFENVQKGFGRSLKG
jgi:hypothetical protein